METPTPGRITTNLKTLKLITRNKVTIKERENTLENNCFVDYIVKNFFWEVIYYMKTTLIFLISIASLCFAPISFAYHTDKDLTEDPIETLPHHRQARHQRVHVENVPENDGNNFYLKIGATVAKEVVFQGCYILSMFADDLSIERNSLLCIGVMTSLAHAIYNFDENKTLFRQDTLSACAGLLTGGLIGSLVGVSMNLTPQGQNEMATLVALTGGMVTSVITSAAQITQTIQRRLFVF